MAGDFFIIIYWWFLFFLFSLFISPLIFFLFEKFWDKGWIFGKTLSLSIISYIVFLLARLKLIGFSKESILLSLVFLLVIDFILLKNKARKKLFLKEMFLNYKRIILIETLFFICLSFWSFIRGFAPRIEGLEKFMDYGFLNSILRSSFFPPKDMWFAGEAINYYYFGHLQGAVITKFSGLDSAITYNLLIATLFGLVFVSCFSLSSNLVYFLKSKEFKKKIKNLKLVFIAGIISALLLSLGGNLHTLIFSLKDGINSYWYPDATRFIGYYPDNPMDKTIHEFPSYSFVVADLHGHVNDLPIVLLFLSLLFVFGVVFSSSKKTDKKKLPIYFILLGFLLGLEYMTNSWDFPIYGSLFAIFFSFLLIFKNGFLKKPLEFLKKELSFGGLLLFLSILFFLPFALGFKPMTNGINLVLAHSLFWQLFVLWGFFWFLAASFLIFFFKNFRKRSFFISDFFVISSVLWATVLIIIPEIIYVKDIYIQEHHRSNTMFKLVYQSFILYSLSSGYIFFRIKGRLTKKKIFNYLFSFTFALFFFAHMIYPYFAIKGYYGNLKPSSYKGLYGISFLKEEYPDDFKAILFIKENIKGQPIVLEAAGDSYTYYNRVSSLTGLPTIQGWFVHEWLWRGGYKLPGQRAEEVEKVFQGEDDLEASNILRKYKVDYVFAGSLEREKYPFLKEKRFENFGSLIFSSGKTHLYKLNLDNEFF